MGHRRYCASVGLVFETEPNDEVVAAHLFHPVAQLGEVLRCRLADMATARLGPFAVGREKCGTQNADAILNDTSVADEPDDGAGSCEQFLPRRCCVIALDDAAFALELLPSGHRPVEDAGHFGRDDPDFTWEIAGKADALRSAAGL